MRSNRTGPIAGVLLAAGASKRMGCNKLFLEFDGEPLLCRSTRQAIAAGLDPVIVVLGFEADRAKEALAKLPCRLVVNPEFERGINSSVCLGIAQLPETSGAAVVMLADMPFVTAEMISALVTRYRRSTAPLVISRYGDIHAPPMLHDRCLFPEFKYHGGEGCGKRIVHRHRSEAVEMDWSPTVLGDLDTPQDYERVKAQLAGKEQECV